MSRAGWQRSVSGVRPAARGRRTVTIAAATCAVTATVMTPIAGAITGGAPAAWSTYPWVASFGDDECSGVLIAPSRALTSAACAELAEGERVRIGSSRRRVKGISLAPGAVTQLARGSRQDCDNSYVGSGCVPNLAIAELSAPVAMTPPRPARARPGRSAIVVGIGTASSDDDGTRPARLRAAALRVMADRRCVARYRRIGRRYAADVRPEHNFCARDVRAPRNAGLCMGDGGAPLVTAASSGWELLGVGDSSPESCGERGEPSVFVDTWRLRHFIRQRAPVWRPRTSRAAHISGRVQPGETLTCHPPRFRGRVDQLIYVFEDFYEKSLQRGPDPTYVVQHRDRKSAIHCTAIAVNRGGIAVSGAGNELDIP